MFYLALLHSTQYCSKEHYIILKNGDCSRESNVLTWFFETKTVFKPQRRYTTQYGKDPPSNNPVTPSIN
jgi:hypothetical protein